MSATQSMKRKVREDMDEDAPRDPKRPKVTAEETRTPQDPPADEPQPEPTNEPPVESNKKKGKGRTIDPEGGEASSRGATYRKLAPPRPFPTVPTSVSATGPRSAHVQGKNYICITRKTPLAAYLRRCKDVILKDGHKTLHLSALGAAIPHLMQLAVSLPEILPYASEEVHTEILTGTVEVQDEVIPADDDDDADISYRTRGKSSVSVVIKVGDGNDEGPKTDKGMGRGRGRGRGGANTGAGRAAGGNFARDKRQGNQQQRTPGGKDSGKQPAGGQVDTGRVVVRLEDLEDP